jgi:hypothetical protein
MISTMATEGIRFDGTRLLPPGPPPPRPPEHLRARGDGAPGFAVEAATLELRANLTIVQQLGGAGQTLSADEIRQRIEAHVKQVFEKAGIEYEELTPEEAQKQVAEGGAWSPQAVSKRILDFVKAFDTGDQARRDLLRDAVEQGYGEAQEAWGGALPEVSGKTIDLVRKGLDDLFGPRSESAAPSPPASA